MLAISHVEIVTGSIVKIPKKWLERSIGCTPSEYDDVDYVILSKIDSIISQEDIYLCESVEEGSNQKIVLAEFVIKYLLATHVEDSNVGLYFSDYLPEDGSKLLITSVQNPSEVVPAVFRHSPELVVVDYRSLVCIRFIIDFINGSGFSSLRYYLNGYKLYKWKYLFGKDDSYMTDYEKMFQDTLIHKDFIIKSCEKLAAYFDSKGAHIYANKLRNRAVVHDNSKISNEEELRALAFIINDKSSMQDPNVKISPLVREAIKIHWKNNSHHPEHYESYLDMSKLDIMEMCCDWHARSMQYKTNFLEFVKKRQEERFHFPDWMFAEIWHYCEVLNEES